MNKLNWDIGMQSKEILLQYNTMWKVWYELMSMSLLCELDYILRIPGFYIHVGNINEKITRKVLDV